MDMTTIRYRNHFLDQKLHSTTYLTMKIMLEIIFSSELRNIASVSHF